MASKQFFFVTGQDRGERSAAEKFQIRSHYMKGLNKRDDSRRSKREAKRAALARSMDAPPVNINPLANEGVSSQYVRAGPLSCQAYTVLSDYNLPLIIDLGPQLTQMAMGMRKSPQELLQGIVTYQQIVANGYLLDSFLHFGDPAGQPQLPPLDHVTVLCMLLLQSVTFNLGQPHSLTNKSRALLVKILQLVNEKLAHQDTCLDRCTVFNVVFLALIAGCMGDLTALKTHLCGLHKILSVRGGIRTLQRDPEAVMAMETIDIMQCLSSGTDPYFLTGSDISGVPFHADQFITAMVQPHLPEGFERVDPRVQSMLQELQRLALLVNQHVDGRTKLSFTVFRPTINPIIIRLLRLERTLTDFTDECLSVGMLMFVTSFLQLKTRRPTYNYISNRVCAIAERSRAQKGVAPRAATAWLLMLSAMSIFDPREKWLRETWSEVVGFEMEWTEVRSQLKKLVWIDGVQDTIGKAAFESIIWKSVP
ncbi:hypothetical protein HJFPF1_13449 [Paramyrothecium foliicola]|nr:hypothetical protein HJFPF1_13449 [Paramyrothecium foliicola]